MATAAQPREEKLKHDPYNLHIMEIVNPMRLGGEIQKWITREYSEQLGSHKNFLCVPGYGKDRIRSIRLGSLINALDARCNPNSVYLLASLRTLNQRLVELSRTDAPAGVAAAIATTEQGKARSVLEIAGGPAFRAKIEEAVEKARESGAVPPMSVDVPFKDSTPLSAQFRTGASSSMPATPLQPPPFQRSPPSLIHTTDVPLKPTPPAQASASSRTSSPPPPKPATSTEKDKQGRSGRSTRTGCGGSGNMG